jgi:hypothetical protein
MKQRPRIYFSTEQKALMWGLAGGQATLCMRLPAYIHWGMPAVRLPTRPAQGWIQAADIESGWPFRTGNT